MDQIRATAPRRADRRARRDLPLSVRVYADAHLIRLVLHRGGFDHARVARARPPPVRNSFQIRPNSLACIWARSRRARGRWSFITDDPLPKEQFQIVVGRSSAPSGQQPCCHEWWSRHAKAGSSLTPPRSSSFLSPCPGWAAGGGLDRDVPLPRARRYPGAGRSSSTSRSTPGGARPTACVRPAADWRASPLRWRPYLSIERSTAGARGSARASWAAWSAVPRPSAPCVVAASTATTASRSAGLHVTDRAGPRPCAACNCACDP